MKLTSRRSPYVLAALIVIASSLSAQATDSNVVRVEEDWVIEMRSPDPSGHAPQIINAMSSTPDLGDMHAVFELNHRTLPDYSAGGMQLQIWSHQTNLVHRPGPKSSRLNIEGEVIRYTMSMKMQEATLEFEVKNGSSSSWGAFGSEGYLKANVAATQSNLTGYSPTVSVAKSRIGYAGHRVKKFALKEVRYYAADGTLLAKDATERIVHQHEDNPDFGG
jgi:hypothetical protein